MTIIWSSGNLFDSGADILVDANNCKGISGAGLALEFKNRFPEYYKQYAYDCFIDRGGTGRLPGTIQTYESRSGQRIVSMTTKDSWKDPSKLEWIDSGLKALAFLLTTTIFGQNQISNGTVQLSSVALGRPGAGYGGLSWENQVRPLVIKYLQDIPNVCYVYGEGP